MRKTQYSTLELTETADGWEVTQDGVSITGNGASGADAAADYCRQVADTENTGKSDTEETHE